jgi:ribokinase
VIVCLGDLFLDVLVDRSGTAESAIEHVAALPGGAAANTASWLAHLGVATGLVGTVGDDPAGDTLIADLVRRGITCAVSRSRIHASGILLLERIADGDVRPFAQRGANDELVIDTAERELLTATTWLHLSAYSFFAEDSRSKVLDAVEIARASGASISIDLGAPHLLQHVGIAEFERLLRATDALVLFANEVEADLLASSAGDPLQVLAGFASIAILKRGKAGCGIQYGGWRFDAAAVPAEEVDPTGAGDAFAAGVIATLSTGGDLPDAIGAGLALGARCVTTAGGRAPLRRMK